MTALAGMEPQIPWAHYFDFGHGLQSVHPTADPRFYKKATGLKIIGEGLADFTLKFLGRDDLTGLSVLDLASGEAGHSLEFANLGAQVLGVEGRDLYIKRAEFAAKAFGFSNNCKFIKSDVRTLGPDQVGTFDITMLLGILHHLGQEDFAPMLKTFASLTKRIGYIYTHVSELDAVTNHRLQGPVMASDKYEGYLFREHKDGATDDQKRDKVRASLDNNLSCWAREEALLQALKDAGFKGVFKVLAPHPYFSPLAQYRVIYGCMK
jgi:hypothetical protein